MVGGKVIAYEVQFLNRLGYLQKEIAEMLGIPEGTVSKLLRASPDTTYKKGVRRKYTERPLLPLWENTSAEWVAKVFYSYLPSWIAERYPRGTIEHALCYESMLWGLWSYKKLQSIKSKERFIKAAYAFVRRRLFGDFRWVSEMKKQAEVYYLTLEEARLEGEPPEEE